MTKVEDGGDAITYVVEVLAFVKQLLAEAAREVEEVGADEKAHGEEEQEGTFSSFSTSLCNFDVSDVGVEVATEEGREHCVVVVGPGTLGKDENGKES